MLCIKRRYETNSPLVAGARPGETGNMGEKMKTELEKLEERSDMLVAEGCETQAAAAESDAFERRVCGIPSRECKNCGEEVGRNQRTCNLCGCRL